MYNTKQSRSIKEEFVVIRSVIDLNGFGIHAADGDIGKVEELYFDDVTWTIRYLVVQTGSWLADRRVLISPISVREADWQNRQILMSLTQDQVRHSPDVDTAKPISRQYETEFHQYYGWDVYWLGRGVWEYKYRSEDPQNPHLRSTKEVTGYHILANDGEIGHVADFLFDNESWQIRYMLLDTIQWWFGKKVIVSPTLIKAVFWAERQIAVDLEREAIKTGPEFDPKTLTK
jgi:uncharacterized protein YrrD